MTSSNNKTYWPKNRYLEVYNRSIEDPEGFWADEARKLDWFKTWDKVLEWNEPFAKWFVGGELNASYLCVDRHAKGPRRNKVAYYFEGEPGDTRAITYAELYREVNKAASMLKKLGLGKGDKIGIYLPMIPELPIIMLACARLGVTFTAVFSGFTAQALADRLNDLEAKVLVTADGGWRRGSPFPLKKVADEAMKLAPTVKKQIVVKRTGIDVEMADGRDLWWHDLMKEADDYVAPESLEASHPLYILYTSGTTGKPKGVVHSTGGYMVYANSTYKWVFNVDENDVYWCTADIGWVTGHTYIVFAPLCAGSTSVMYEGAPNFPDLGRWWDIIEKYGVNVLYTSPTAIRMFRQAGEEWLEKSDLSSLKLLGSVGEPINPDTWVWYYDHVGKGRCPIVDTWWQTETGGILISPGAGHPDAAAQARLRQLPAARRRAAGRERERRARSGRRARPPDPQEAVARHAHDPLQGPRALQGGLLDPLPRQLPDRRLLDPGRGRLLLAPRPRRRGHQGRRSPPGHAGAGERRHLLRGRGRGSRYRQARRGQGRVDHHLRHPEGRLPSVIAGGDQPMEAAIKKHIRDTMGPIATPERVFLVKKLPKTRSGKIMRRLLKAVAMEVPLGDATTLEDGASIAEVQAAYEELKEQV